MTTAAPKSEVTAYALDVNDGRVVAGRLVRLACERHLRDLDEGHKRGLHFDEKAAERVLQFFGFLVQRKGEWAKPCGTCRAALGKPHLKGCPEGTGTVGTLVLQPWQKFRIGSVFGWKREDGFRRFREAYNEVARKNGKTTEAAGVGNYLAFFDGEPGAEVYAAATKRDQARICWSEAKWQIEHLTPALRVGITALTHNIHSLSTGSKFDPLGADADSTDGLNIHGAIGDEIHQMKDRRYWESIDTAMGARRQPLAWKITTAGYNRDSLCWDNHEYGIKVLEGTVQDDTLFVYIATIDDPEKWLDESEWPKANPGLGITPKLDYLRAKFARAAAVPREENAAKQRYLNLWTQQSTRWISLELWDAQRSRGDLDEMEGRACVAGLALSGTRDVACLALWFPGEDEAADAAAAWLAGDEDDEAPEDVQFDPDEDDGDPEDESDEPRLAGGGSVFIISWCPEEGIRERSQNTGAPYGQWEQDGLLHSTPGDVVSFKRIRKDLEELRERFDIQSIATHPWQALQLVNELEEDGFTVAKIPQNMGRLAPPTMELERLVRSKLLRHGGDQVLRWMAGNVAVKRNGTGQFRIDPEMSSENVAGMAALVLALEEALANPGDGRSVYEDRGIVSA